MAREHSCSGCGAAVDFSAHRCPYCGNNFIPIMGSSAALSKNEAGLSAHIGEIEAKLAKKPQDGKLWLALGEAYHHHRDFKKAQEALEKAASLLPGRAEIHYLLAWNCGLMNGWECAAVAEHAQQALSLNPEFKGAQALLHLHKGVQKQLFARSFEHAELALQEFRTAVQLDPKNTYGYYFAGCVFETHGEPEKAVQMFQRAADLSVEDVAPSKDDARIFARTGYVYRQLKDFESAKKYLSRALELDPDNAAAREILSSLN